MLRFEGNSPAAGKDDKNTASLSKQHLGKRLSSDNTAAAAAASSSSSSESGEGSEQEQQQQQQQHRSSKHQNGKKKIKSSHLPIYEEYQPPTPEEPVAVTGSLFDPLTQPGTLSVAQRLEALEKLLQTSLAAASSKTSASSAQTLPVIPPLGSSSSTKVKETSAPVASSVAKKLKTKKQLKEAAQQKINELLSLFAD